MKDQENPVSDPKGEDTKKPVIIPDFNHSSAQKLIEVISSEYARNDDDRDGK